jgi:hypothetical protein
MRQLRTDVAKKSHLFRDRLKAAFNRSPRPSYAEMALEVGATVSAIIT